MRHLGIIVLSLATSASAQTFTIDFNNLSTGVTLSNQFLASNGVNFIPNAFSGPNSNNTAEPWATNTGLTVSDYVALDPARPGYAVGSPMLFDGNLVRTIADYNNEDGDASVLTTFASPITSATVTFVGIAFFEAGAFDTQLLALDANNQILAQTHAVGAATTSQQNLTVTVPAGFSRLAIVPGNYNDIVGFDNLVYTLAAPAVPTWNIDANGNYWTTANWSTNQVPSGPTASARFGSIITQPRTVTLNDTVVLNKVIFDSTASYTLHATALNGSYALRLGGTQSELNVVQGSHQIEALVTNNSSSVATNLVKSGAGSVSVQKLVLNGNLAVNEGALSLSGGAAVASKVTSVSVADGALLTQGTTPLLVTSMTVDSIRQLLLAGKIAVGGQSTLKIGYVLGTLVSYQYTTVGGENIAATDVVVRATLPGDATLNLHVDFDDLLLLAKNYGRTGADWWTADFNYDGVTNFDDLIPLSQNYGAGALSDAQLELLDPSFVSDFRTALSLVPEPGMIALAPVVLSTSKRKRK